jgi:uncharacterized C2H2 Zn-finger protein
MKTHPEYVAENLFCDSMLKYECDACNMVFKRNDALRNHQMKEHTGERPYKCDVCDAAFRKKFSHKRNIHKDALPCVSWHDL